MNPEEKHMLERSLRISSENHKMLLKMERRVKWTMLWGFVKLVVIAIPLFLGYIYLEPYFAKAAQGYNSFQELVGHIDLLF